MCVCLHADALTLGVGGQNETYSRTVPLTTRPLFTASLMSLPYFTHYYYIGNCHSSSKSLWKYLGFIQ